MNADQRRWVAMMFFFVWFSVLGVPSGCSWMSGFGPAAHAYEVMFNQKAEQTRMNQSYDRLIRWGFPQSETWFGYSYPVADKGVIRGFMFSKMRMLR